VRRSAFLIPLLLTLLIPTQSWAHGGVAHPHYGALPKLELLASASRLDPNRLLWGNNEGLIAVGDSQGSLRLAIKRSRKGISAYQKIGHKLLKLPADSVFLRSGIKDGIRLQLIKDGVTVQRSSVSWCPSGTEPMNDTARPALGAFYQACGVGVSLFVEAGIDTGWFGSIYSTLLGYHQDYSPELHEGPIYLPALAGDYKLKVTLDPQHVLHVSQASKMSRTFDISFSQSMLDSLVSDSSQRPTKKIASSFILPDLKAMPATGISLQSLDTGYPDQVKLPEMLSFDAMVWNASPGMLVVRANRSSSNSSSMTAYQTLTNRKGESRRTVKIGRLVWSADDGHNHWHYDGLARYRILNNTGQTVAQSGKVGFCFADTTPVDSRLFAPYKANDQSYGNLGCGYRWSLSVAMELDAGWGDTYTQSVAGQAFDVSHLPNGSYALEVKANAGPYAKIREQHYDNNTSLRHFMITGSFPDRQVRVSPWGGEPADSLSPGQL